MKRHWGIAACLSFRVLAVSLLAGWLSFGPATARAGTISEISPFIGDISEDWESFPTTPVSEEPEFLESPFAFLSGQAALEGTGMVIYEPGVADFFLGTSGSATTSDGSKGWGINGFQTTARITFETPVLEIGAYWGAVTRSTVHEGDVPAQISVKFFDDNNDFVGEGWFSYIRDREPQYGNFGDGLLEWHGWQFEVAVKSLEVSSDFIVMDGLQVRLVPEPATAVLMLSSILMLCARCRREGFGEAIYLVCGKF